MRRTIALAAVVLSACGELAHDSPYDPQAPAASQARSSLTGVVTLEPVGGVTPSLAGIAVSVAGQSWSATTDAAGRYTISGVPPGGHTVQAVATSYQPATANVNTTLDTGGKLVQVPTLALTRLRATLAGTVNLNLPSANDGGAVNPATETTGGAVVSLGGTGGVSGMAIALRPSRTALAALAGTSQSAVTGGDGSYVIPDVPAPNGTYTVTVSKYGYVTATSTITFVDGGFVVQTVELATDPGAVRGAVVVPGAPANTDVTVRARGTTAAGTPWSDAIPVPLDGSGRGDYLFSGLPSGSYEISYHLVDYGTVSASAAVAPGAETPLGDAILTRLTGGATGAVALSQSASSAGAVVTLTGTHGTYSAVSAADGAFTFAGVPVGRYTVSVGKDPDWQRVLAADVDVLAGAITALTGSPFTLLPVATAAISGSVLLEGGADPRGVSVSLDGTDFRGRPVALATNPTSTAGTFSFPALVAGTYQVSFSAAGYDASPPVGVAVSTGQPAGVGTVTLAASRGGVTGVVDAAGTTNDAGTIVTVSGGPDTASAVTDAFGRWRINGLRVGSGYTAAYVRTGYATATSAAFAITAGGLSDRGTASLAVDTTASVRGVAHVERGSDANIGVSLSGSDLNGNAVTGSGSTDGSGNWSVGSLPQGTYRVVLSKTSYDSQVISGIAVVAGGTATAATVTLPVATGIVAGQAILSKGSATTFAQGTDHSGIVVTLSGLDPGVSVPAAVTDTAGSFRLEGVPVSTSGSAYGVTAQRANYTSATGTVTPSPSASTAVIPATMTLPVNVGSVVASVLVNDTGTPATPPSSTVTLSLTGTAFNATSFGASGGNTNGSVTLANLPAGTYDVIATAANRSCGNPVAVTVSPGAQTTVSGTFTCVDAVAPGVPVLGLALNTTGGVPGYVASTAATVPVTTGVTDGNFRGYQWAVGPTPTWTQTNVVTAASGVPVNVPVTGLAADAANTVWIRAVDLVWNGGTPVSTTVVTDSIAPLKATITTPRLWVNDTTTSVTISGGSDANFGHHEMCSFDQAVTTACPTCTCGATGSCTCGSGACTFTATDATFALPIGTTPGKEKTCVYARAVDKAGRGGALDSREIVSDLQPPVPPRIGPTYDPASLSIRSGWVDLFIDAAATDTPGAGAGWAGIAWIEVDSGFGFSPLCPAAECHAGGVYHPCSCGCADPRLRCSVPSGGSLAALRVPLASVGRNRVAVRAVDLAGNIGDAAGQEIQTDDSASVAAVSAYGAVYRPRISGAVLTYEYYDGSPGKHLKILDLGSDGRAGTGDPGCDVAALPNVGAAAPASGNFIAFTAGAGSLYGVRKGASWCGGSTPFPIGSVTNLQYVAAAGERVAYAGYHPSSGTSRAYVTEPGMDRLAGTPDDLETPLLVTTIISALEAGGRAVLIATKATSSAPPAWQVMSASKAFSQGFQALALPMSSDDQSSLSQDGGVIAYTDARSGTRRLCARFAGANGVFDAADATTCVTPVEGLPAPRSIATDGVHVVVADGGAKLTHWDAGPDGVLGTPDDALTVIRRSSSPQNTLAISGGLLVWEEAGAILLRDLSAMRWETLSPDLAGFGVNVDTNGEGTLLWAPGTITATVYARSPGGYETALPSVGSEWDATGSDFVYAPNPTQTLYVRHPDPTTGLMFQGTTAPVPVYSTPRTITRLVVKPGRAAFWEVSGPDRILRVIEARGASLDTATSSDVFTLDTVSNVNIRRPALAAHQALYGCGPSNWEVCVAGAGPDDFFGTGDEPAPAARLTHPAGSPRAGALVDYARGLKADGSAIVVSEGAYGSHGSGLYAFDAGLDGLFGTADDSGYLVSQQEPQETEFSVAGDWVAYLDAGSPGGKQVFLLNLRDRSVRQLTFHFSTKSNLIVERSGRVLWIDGILARGAIFTRMP